MNFGWNGSLLRKNCPNPAQVHSSIALALQLYVGCLVDLCRFLVKNPNVKQRLVVSDTDPLAPTFFSKTKEDDDFFTESNWTNKERWLFIEFTIGF